MENKKLHLMWAVVGILFCWMTIVLIPESEEAPVSKAQEREIELELAVLSAKESLYCGYPEGGYEYSLPSQSVEKFVQMMNAPLSNPVEEKYYYEPDSAPREIVITYVIGKAKTSWQVVLKPDDKIKKIKIVGYGSDLLNPLINEVVECRQ